jgi:hypothetical protein
MAPTAAQTSITKLITSAIFSDPPLKLLGKFLLISLEMHARALMPCAASLSQGLSQKSGRVDP